MKCRIRIRCFPSNSSRFGRRLRRLGIPRLTAIPHIGRIGDPIGVAIGVRIPIGIGGNENRPSARTGWKQPLSDARQRYLETEEEGRKTDHLRGRRSVNAHKLC